MNNQIWLALLNTFDGDEDVMHFFNLSKSNYLKKIKIKPKAYRLTLENALPEQIAHISQLLTANLYARKLVVKKKPRKYKYDSNNMVVIL